MVYLDVCGTIRLRSGRALKSYPDTKPTIFTFIGHSEAGHLPRLITKVTCQKEDTMHNRYCWVAAFALAVIVAGCNQAPPPAPDTHDADVKAIRDVAAAQAQAFAAKDLDKACAVYADDASLFMPDSPVLNGVAAIKAAMKPLFADKNSSGTFVETKAEVARSGDLGYLYGAYTVTMTDPKTKKVLSEKGTDVMVFKKQSDGSWKAIVDIMSEEARPRLQGAPKSNQRVSHHKRPRK
jgi:uncharacterized protein (TIGR02246 family)